MKASFLLVGLAACVPNFGDESEDGSAGVGSGGDDNVLAESMDQDADGASPEDSGDAQGESGDQSLNLDGQMEAEYTYNGSLGEFTADCGGAAFIAIDSDGAIDGEGTCENEVITFNFTIEGTRDGDDLTGILVGESSAGRAETPFAGVLQGDQTELVFDHTHAADGEALRLVGTILLESSE